MSRSRIAVSLLALGAAVLSGFAPGASHSDDGRFVVASGPAPARAASPEGESEADIAGASTSGRALVVGDSLEVLTSPYLQRHLPGVKVTINAVGGYSSPQIYRLFQESYDPSQAVIVFDAGTNDNPASPQILAAQLQAVASTIGDRCMVVPTIHGLTVDGHTSAGKNRAVEAFVRSRPGTQMPDWAAVAASLPRLMQADDIHPTAAGADFRAQLIAQGIKACLNFHTAREAAASLRRLRRADRRDRAQARERRRAQTRRRHPPHRDERLEPLSISVPNSVWLLLAVSCLPADL